MEIMHGESRSLLSWLIAQEKVIHMWIDEIIDAGPCEQGLVESLETHRRWLAARIQDLKGRAA